MRERKERKRAQHTGKGRPVPFIGLPRPVVDSEQFGNLSGNATKLLMELARQYRGNNNGDFSCAWSQATARGWSSPGTLNRAKRELVDAGWIIVSRQGGKHRCSLYAVTWWAIDDCNGKHDLKPTHAALNTWQKTQTLDRMRTNVVPMRTNSGSKAAA